MTSKTLLVTRHGGYKVMAVEERRRPSAGQGQVVVNIRATGVNFGELMCRQGSYPDCPKLPAVLGVEGSGDVTEVGPGVDTLKIGDRVIAYAQFGLWTEYAVVDADCCYVMPDRMTYEEGAAILTSYVTAYHMLFDFGNLRKGQSVLVHMAAGGVGMAATQLCRTVPDVTVFGTSSAQKHDAIKKNGMDYPIDYRTKDYVAEIQKISPEGVDIVLDPLSGADSVKGFNLLKPLGRIIHFGAANMVSGQRRSLWNIAKSYLTTGSYTPMGLFSLNRAVSGYNLGALMKAPGIVRVAVEALIDLYNQELIKPITDSVWAFEDSGMAMARMHDRLNVGKVIMSPQKAPVAQGSEDTN